MILKTSTRKAITILKDRGIFTLEHARQAGISHQTIIRLVKSDQIGKVTRGVYYDPTHDWSGVTDITFGAASLLFGPDSYIGGHSALDYYGLCIDTPVVVDVVVSPTTRTTRDGYRAIRTNLNRVIGIEKKLFHRIASPERAVLDAMYFSHLWETKGFAFGMLRTAITKKLVTFNNLEKMAEKLRISAIFKSYSEYLHREVLEPM